MKKSDQEKGRKNNYNYFFMIVLFHPFNNVGKSF